MCFHPGKRAYIFFPNAISYNAWSFITLVILHQAPILALADNSKVCSYPENNRDCDINSSTEMPSIESYKPQQIEQKE